MLALRKTLVTALVAVTADPGVTLSPQQRTMAAEYHGRVDKLQRAFTGALEQANTLRTKTQAIQRALVDSPADEAGIVRDDIVVTWDGKPINSPRDLSVLVAATPIGKVVPAEVIRGVERQTIEVKVADRPLTGIRIRP